MEMRSRSKVAAAAASVVPFHCVICFDEFNLHDRTPMVLPCGHTFVCLQCTKRLKKCMECREPLFLPSPRPTSTTPSPNMYSRSTGRYSPQPPQTPPHHYHASVPPPPPMALPIPKNVVLVAMMEAAERQAKVETEMTVVKEGDDDEEEDEEFNLDRIISGMATMSGPCGTYTVVDEDGLAVVPTDPRKRRSLNVGEEKKMEFMEGEEEEDHASISLSASKASAAEPFLLQKGQSVQVVDFEDGVAKLARDMGYIVATSSQLVKVGGPLETVCRLEGLLDTIESRGRDLQATLDENRQIEASLRKQIEAELESDPTHPVISEPPVREDILYSASKDASDTSGPRTPTFDDHSNQLLQTPEKMPSGESLTLPASAETYPGDENRYADRASYPRSPNSIDNSELLANGLPTYRRTVSEDDLDQLVFGCGAAFLGRSTGLFSANNTSITSDTEQEMDLLNLRPRNRAAETDQSLMMHAAPTLTSSFDGIDFRTGLSGHRGLTNTKSKTGSSPTPRGRQVRMMMSEHRGIARVRGPPARRDSPTGAPALGPRFSPFPHS